MKAAYKGPEIAVEIFGTIFPRGEAVDVTDKHAVAKLKTHPEFSVDGKPAPIEIKAKEQADAE